MENSSKYAGYAWSLIGSIAAIRLIIAFFLPVAPQEAYYWNYALHPALSYFDHPPMTAYLILLFTRIFGNNFFGVHFASIFISFVLSLVLYYSVRIIFDDRTAFWTVVVGSSTFIFALGGLVITPDAPLLLFWMLTMFSLYFAVKQSDLKLWLLTGIFLGCAFVSKYTAAFAALGLLLYLISSRERLSNLLKPGPYISAIAAFIVFLPVVVWNYSNNWASFGFQSGRRASEISHLRPDAFFGFLGSQIGVLAIFLFPLFIWALIKAAKYLKQDERVALYFWFAAPTAIFFTLVAWLVYVKMNWLAPAYLSVLPPAVYFVLNSSKKFIKIYSKLALTFSIVLTLAVHILVFIPEFGFGKGDTLHGWSELADKVEQVRNDMEASGPYFICGYEYKPASELRFYLRGQPETVSDNIVGGDGLQYDFWCNPDTLVGKNCIFVYDTRNSYHGDLSNYFNQVDEPEILTVQRGGKKITDFYIYKCYDYRGIR